MQIHSIFKRQPINKINFYCFYKPVAEQITISYFKLQKMAVKLRFSKMFNTVLIITFLTQQLTARNDSVAFKLQKSRVQFTKNYNYMTNNS